MIYFGAKYDLEFIKQYHTKVVRLFELEEMDFRRVRPPEGEELRQEYADLREGIARDTQKVQRIAGSNRIPQVFQSYPAPAVGGPIIPVNVFSAILNDDGHAPMPRQRKLDILNELIGSIEERIRREFRQLINPLFWLNSLLQVVLRIPFWIFQSAGFKTESFEESLAGKILLLVEMVVLLALLSWLGFSNSELKELIAAWATRNA